MILLSLLSLCHIYIYIYIYMYICIYIYIHTYIISVLSLFLCCFGRPARSCTWPRWAGGRTGPFTTEIKTSIIIIKSVNIEIIIIIMIILMISILILILIVIVVIIHYHIICHAQPWPMKSEPPTPIRTPDNQFIGFITSITIIAGLVVISYV